MKQILNSAILFILFGLISVGLKAQKLNYKYYLFNKKTELFPKSLKLNNIVFDSTFSNNLETLSSNSIVLPLDNMVCLLPPDNIKYQIQLFNPQPTSDSYIDNMPNALPKIDLVK